MEGGSGGTNLGHDPNKQRVHGIYVGGLSAQEQKILHGVVRLAEHDRRRFRFEADAMRADVLLLDGASVTMVQLIRASAAIARRAIVIDPPPGLTHPQVLRRPIRWTPLLRLLEQLVGGPTALAATATPRPAAQHAADRLNAVAVDVLRRYLGPAAEFVVEDIAAAQARGGDRAAAFLAALKAQLPPSIDPDRVVAEVAAAAGIRHL